MNFSDTYSYRIVVTAAGIAQAQDLAGAMAAVGVKIEMTANQARSSAVQYAHMQAALDNIEYQATRTAAALENMGTRGFGGIGRGAGMAGAGLGSFTNMLALAASGLDDLQYGSKNVANNFIAVALMAPHPAIRLTAIAAAGLTSVFHKQIDAALGLGQAYQKAGKEAEAAAGKMETFSQRLAEQLKNDAVEFRKAGDDMARTVDDLSKQEREGLLGAMIGTEYADQQLIKLKEAALRARQTAEQGNFLTRRSALKNEAEILARIQEYQDKAAEARKKNLDKLIADTARGDQAAREKLEALALKAGAGDLVTALQKMTPAFAAASAEAMRFAQKLEDMAEAEKKVKEAGKDWLQKRIEDLKEWAKARQEDAAEEEREHQRRLERIREVREAEQGERAGVVANAFRGQLSGGIASVINAAMANGASVEQAKGMAFTRAAGVMNNAGVDRQGAVDAAAKLVEEQYEAIRQQNANMDAILGMFVGQFRQATMARREAAAQANQIRQAQMMMRAQNPWNNNRPGWP